MPKPTPSPTVTQNTPTAPVVVRAHDLRKTYTLGEETIHALDGVSLEINRGEFVAVMGPSGSGKSTLLHLLGLLENPDGGEVTIAGRHTADLDDDALTKLRRDKLGFIFQNFELIPNLSAQENVLLPAEVAGRRKQAETRLAELAQDLGITDRLSHRPKQLSGGQQQRVAIARALINDPAVILADEPTGNLDSDTGREVLELLQRGVREQGWTVVMVTHDPNAAQFAERLIILRDGHIVKTLRSDDAETGKLLETLID